MTNKPTLAYRISIDLNDLFCEIHHLSLSTRHATEFTVVKVCCNHFKDEVKERLQKQYGDQFVDDNVRFQLPGAEISGINTGKSMTDE